jgi:hypothetical protein
MCMVRRSLDHCIMNCEDSVKSGRRALMPLLRQSYDELLTAFQARSWCTRGLVHTRSAYRHGEAACLDILALATAIPARLDR